MKKNRWIGVGIVVLTGTLALGCGAGQAESGQSSEELKLVSIEKGTEGSTVSRQNENMQDEQVSDATQDEHIQERNTEIRMGGDCDVKPDDYMVMVHGKLYVDTGEKNSMLRCGVMDGNITDYVPSGTIPQQNNQANFSEVTGYQYGLRENRIEVPLEDGWHIFAFNENNLTGCTMEVSKVTPTDCTVIFGNRTGDEITFGEDFSLEVREEETGEWRNVPIIFDGDWAFNMIGYPVQSGKDREWDVDWSWLYGSLEEGNYRIVKTVLVTKEPEYYWNHTWEDTKFTLSCEFET